jgi:hypothetical protein
MKEPKQIPLSDNPRSKQVLKYRLASEKKIEENTDLNININEDNIENNSQSIQQLESESSD